MIRFILIICLSLFSLPLVAQDRLQPLPQVQVMDAMGFAEASRALTQNFERDKALDFKIQIPGEFTVIAPERLKNNITNNRLIGEIFRAVGPLVQEVRPYISVRSLPLDRMISARNWLVVKVLEDGLTLRGIESDPRGDTFDAFFVRLDDFGKTELVRSRGFLNRDRIVVIEYSLPLEIWDQLPERDKQIFTAQSFEFLLKSSVETPEPVRSFSFLDSFYVEFPQSWILTQDNVGQVNTLDLSFSTVDKNNFVFAQARLDVVSELSLKDASDLTIYPVDLPRLIEVKRKDVGEMGFDIGTVMDRRKYDIGLSATLNATEVYPLRRKQSDTYVTYEDNPITREYWVTLIRTPDKVGRNYLFTMVAPYRNKDLYHWALAAKAYEYILESIR